MNTDDPFRRIDYRRFVAWKRRIEREMPFLKRVFGEPGARPLLDVACGTGEHVQALTEEGYAVIGLDVSEAMLQKAREAFPELPLVGADMAQMPIGHVDGLGGAYCLGNSLAILREDVELRSLFASLRRSLVDGAPFLIQILNYRRILENGVRHLPLNFRSGDESELLYLRLLDPIDERRIRFEVLTLERRPPEGESRIVHQVSRVMRPLRDQELRRFLGEAGFERVEFFGDVGGGDYAALESSDLIAVAR